MLKTIGTLISSCGMPAGMGGKGDARRTAERAASSSIGLPALLASTMFLAAPEGVIVKLTWARPVIPSRFALLGI